MPTSFYQNAFCCKKVTKDTHKKFIPIQFISNKSRATLSGDFYERNSLIHTEQKWPKIEPDDTKLKFMQILLKAFHFIDHVCPYSIIHKCHRRQITIKLH